MKTVRPHQFAVSPAPRLLLPPYWLAIVLGLVGTFASNAEPIRFQAEVEGVSRTAAVDEIEFDGVPHVSVVSLTEQMGGSATILPTRARLEVAGSTAWIQSDDNRVNAFRIFSLGRPVVRANEDFLIASGDVAPFFENAFRIAIVRERGDTMMDAPAPGSASPGPAEEPPVTQPEPLSRGPVPAVNIDVIVIDPGHGGFEAGIESAGGLAEKSLVLDVAMRLKAVLETRTTQKIVLTREDDLALNETQRGAIVQNADADLLISLHAGSSLSPAVRGSVVFYEAGNSRVHGRRMTDREDARRLANLIVESLRTVPAVPLRGFDTVETRAMAHPGIPGVMVEIGCLTNIEDEAALDDDATRMAVVNAIAEGVLRFLGVRGDTQQESAG